MSFADESDKEDKTGKSVENQEQCTVQFRFKNFTKTKKIFFCFLKFISVSAQQVFFSFLFRCWALDASFFPAVHEVTVSLICFHFPVTLGTNPVTGPRVRIPPRLWDRVDFSKAPLVSFRSKFVLAKRIIHDLLGQT